ncbi:hypothetical protein ACT6NV_10125 [Robiginitalea sp. IMCC44478]|uniref:hypothetical protein n=1 Tax=Robiginitalea sp. IMCC44478 TaxID=3459122 RepID=UPI00404261CB
MKPHMYYLIVLLSFLVSCTQEAEETPLKSVNASATIVDSSEISYELNLNKWYVQKGLMALQEEKEVLQLRIENGEDQWIARMEELQQEEAALKIDFEAIHENICNLMEQQRQALMERMGNGEEGLEEAIQDLEEDMVNCGNPPYYGATLALLSLRPKKPGTTGACDRDDPRNNCMPPILQEGSFVITAEESTTLEIRFVGAEGEILATADPIGENPDFQGMVDYQMAVPAGNGFLEVEKVYQHSGETVVHRTEVMVE